MTGFDHCRRSQGAITTPYYAETSSKILDLKKKSIILKTELHFPKTARFSSGWQESLPAADNEGYHAGKITQQERNH